MKRADELKPGQIIQTEICLERIKEAHNFPALEIGNGAYTPACTLLIFQDWTLSVAPHARFKVIPPHKLPVNAKVGVSPGGNDPAPAKGP